VAVTGRISDTGQNILKSSHQTGSNSSRSYFHIFSLIAFLEEAFIRKIITALIIIIIIIIIIMQ
jgi:t-SNARE complex subunit (syntaxin)